MTEQQVCLVLPINKSIMEHKDIILRQIKATRLLQDLQRKEIVTFSDGHYLVCNEEDECFVRKSHSLSVDIPILLDFYFEISVQHTYVYHSVTFLTDAISIYRGLSNSNEDKLLKINWENIQSVEIVEVDIQSLPDKDPKEMWQSKMTISALKITSYDEKEYIVHSVYFGQYANNEYLQAISNLISNVANRIQKGEEIVEEEIEKPTSLFNRNSSQNQSTTPKKGLFKF